jgi:hypothetical protein
VFANKSIGGRPGQKFASLTCTAQYICRWDGTQSEKGGVGLLSFCMCESLGGRALRFVIPIIGNWVILERLVGLLTLF